MVNQYLSDPDYADQIRDLMMEHFRDDWEQHEDWKRIVSDGYGLEAAAILRYRRSLTRETLDGKYVKSLGRKLLPTSCLNMTLTTSTSGRSRGTVATIVPTSLFSTTHRGHCY